MISAVTQGLRSYIELAFSLFFFRLGLWILRIRISLCRINIHIHCFYPIYCPNNLMNTSGKKTLRVWKNMRFEQTYTNTMKLIVTSNARIKTYGWENSLGSIFTGVTSLASVWAQVNHNSWHFICETHHGKNQSWTRTTKNISKDERESNSRV